jgi:hypothetical protein
LGGCDTGEETRAEQERHTYDKATRAHGGAGGHQAARQSGQSYVDERFTHYGVE